VVTKMDVLDTLARSRSAPITRSRKVTDTIPADMRGFESIEPVLHT